MAPSAPAARWPLRHLISISRGVPGRDEHPTRRRWGQWARTSSFLVTNDRLSIQTRDGVQLAGELTLSSFWAGATLKGGALFPRFDPEDLLRPFQMIVISSLHLANAQTVSSAVLFAVSQTGDPTGNWNRYALDADPASTVAGGKWIDYPSVGFNKNWFVVMENVFAYGTSGGSFVGPAVYVLDKQAAYSNTLTSISVLKIPLPTALRHRRNSNRTWLRFHHDPVHRGRQHDGNDVFHRRLGFSIGPARLSSLLERQRPRFFRSARSSRKLPTHGALTPRRSALRAVATCRSVNRAPICRQAPESWRMTTHSERCASQRNTLGNSYRDVGSDADGCRHRSRRCSKSGYTLWYSVVGDRSHD